MPLPLLPFISTLAIQVGSAWYNSRKNKAHSAEMARKQQAYEEKVTREGIENARAEFAEMCALQRELDREMQRDRLELIKDSHNESITLEAYAESLRNWPLMVPPYVIKNESILSLEADTGQAIPLNCILASSSDGNFNNAVYFRLEENLADFCSRYWNVSAVKSIRFLQETWRDTYSDADSKRKNLYVHLKHVPTLVISPIIKNDKLLFRFYWWGLSVNPAEAHVDEVNELDPELTIPITRSQQYTQEEINQILNECTPKLEAFISYFADLYYWNFYKESPTLPSLISSTNDLRDLRGSDSAEEFRRGLLRGFEESSNADLISNLNCYKSILTLNHTITQKEKQALLQKIASILHLNIDRDDFDISSLIYKHNICQVLSTEETKLLNEIITDIENLSTNTSHTMTSNNLPTANTSKTMTAKEYSVYRDELLALIKDIKKISYLPKEQEVAFNDTERKIQEDQFSVALIGEFQGGKSTTFDALCGGREISPRGNNIKTSACKITATNIAGDGEEYAFVTWKSDAELVQTMSPLLEEFCTPEDFGYEAGPGKVFSYSDQIKFTNPRHIKVLKEAIKSAKDATTDSISDILPIAQFIVEFYDSTKEIRKQSKFTIQEAYPLMTFPSNMMERFNASDKQVSDFSPAEAAFAFVQTVNCRIHSKQLESLGCTFIDCPGLFASEYDTSIAMNTINTSDAVLYLCGGVKAMGQDDKRAIRKIWDKGLIGNPDFIGENIFFAINQQKSQNETSFITNDLSQINEIGFHKEMLPLYNAYLYYYAQFGISYVNGTLDSYTLDRFLHSSTTSYASIEEKWVEEVKRALIRLELDKKISIEELTAQSATALLNLSQSETLFDSINDYIVKNRAHAILVENGALKIQEGLQTIQNTLRVKEDSARKSVAERAEEAKKARQELDKFCIRVDERIKSAFTEKLKHEYTTKVYERYFADPQMIETVAFEATKSLLTFSRKGRTKWLALKSKFSDEAEEELKGSISTLINSAFNQTVTEIVKKWVTIHYNDKDTDFNDIVIPVVKRLSEDIHNEWSVITTKMPILSTLIPLETKTTLSSIEFNRSIGSRSVDANTLERTVSAAINDIINQITAPIIATIVGAIALHILDLFLTGGIALFISAIVAALTWLGVMTPDEIKTPQDFKGKSKDLFEQVQSKLTMTLMNHKVKSEICFKEDGLISLINNDAKTYEAFYRKMLADKKTELDNNIRKSEEEYASKKDELMNIAQESQRVLEHEVQPLSNKLTAFIQRVTK